MSETMAVRWGTTLPRITPSESADWEELGRHLNSRRAELGWSRRQAAERAEISQSTWNKLENAKTRSVRQETLTKIALALNPDDPERANAERRTLYRLAGVPLREPISANSEVTTDVRLAIVERVLTQVVRRLLEAGILSEDEFRRVLS